MRLYKLALVSDWYYPKVGGIEYSMDSLARNLKQLGHEVHIITRAYDDQPPVSLDDGLPVIRLPGRTIGGRLASPAAFRELSENLKQQRYDIVHAHGFDSTLAIMSMYAGRKLNLTCIATNHSLLGQTLVRKPMLALGSCLLHLVDAVICVSNPVAEETRLMCSAPVYTVPNGVDQRSPAGRAVEFFIKRRGRLLITTVSRLTQKKRVGDIVGYIAPRLLERFDHLHFVLVGDGPMRPGLERKAAALGIAEHVHFTGEVSRASVFHLLDQSDIFMLPSQREGFGITILEAFSKKVPVVARNHSGVSDIISHNETGLLANDAREMVTLLQRLIENRTMMSDLASRAYREVSKYQWPDVARSVSRIYDRLIDENRRLHR